MTTRILFFLTLVLAGGVFASTAIAQSGAEIPENFQAASPAKGLWKGWPIGTTVTFRRTLTDRRIGMHSVQFHRLMLVGRSNDGLAVVAGYRSEQEAGPWQFAQSASGEMTGFFREPGIRQVSERPDKLVVDGKPVDCVVRVYAGIRETRWRDQVKGEEWTIGQDGPAIKSSVSVSYEIAGQKYGNAETVTCAGQEKLKVGTQEVTAFQTVEERRMGEKVIGGRTRQCWSEKVPGWFVCRRSWNQPDEQQPPDIEDEVIAFGPDATLLDRYVKTDRPPEAENAKLWSQLKPTTRPASVPAR
jgi:hypothetical protein